MSLTTDRSPMPPAPTRRWFPTLTTSEDSYLGEVFRRETVGGMVALGAAALAVVWANSPLGDVYQDLQHVEIGPLDLHHWAADGLLTLFFFVAGLELKREFTVGSLRNPVDAAVPVLAAAFGVMLPALVYVAVNSTFDGELGGWAIPSATDIAFALAVLAVVGSNLPTSLRAFLLTLAVVDDLIVIAIIAVFFSSSLDWAALGLAALAIATYAGAFRWGMTSPLLLVPLSAAAWWFTLESGVHATIAGVALGLLTPVTRKNGRDRSPLERLEHTLSPVSSAVAVPIFALMSAGVVLTGGAELVQSPIVLGVVLGLLLGKPVGVLLGAWIATRFTRAELNAELSWRDLLGVAVLAGIGFTVSLLVADLSFEDELRDLAKTGVLAGSVLSAVAGALVLGHRDRFHATP